MTWVQLGNAHMLSFFAILELSECKLIVVICCLCFKFLLLYKTISICVFSLFPPFCVLHAHWWCTYSWWVLHADMARQKGLCMPGNYSNTFLFARIFLVNWSHPHSSPPPPHPPISQLLSPQSPAPPISQLLAPQSPAPPVSMQPLPRQHPAPPFNQPLPLWSASHCTPPSPLCSPEVCSPPRKKMFLFKISNRKDKIHVENISSFLCQIHYAISPAERKKKQKKKKELHPRLHQNQRGWSMPPTKDLRNSNQGTRRHWHLKGFCSRQYN